MNTVRRKTVRPKGKKNRFLLLLPVLLLATGIGCAVHFARRPAVVELPRKADTTTVFSNRSIEEIVSMTVTTADETYTVLQQDGTWHMAGDDGFRFDQSMLSSFLYEGATVITEYTVGRLDSFNGLTEADFGLEEAQCIRAEVNYTDGSRLCYRIGARVPEEMVRYYFMVENDDTVYAVSRDMYDTLCLSSRALHTVPSLALRADLIDAVTFEGDAPFRMERRSEGWYMTSPFEYPLSTAAVETLLSKLEVLRLAQCVAGEGAELTPYGLVAPRRVVTLDIAASTVTGYDSEGNTAAETTLDPYSLTFACGDPANDVSFYCLYRGRVYKATDFSAGFLLSQGYETLLSASPVSIPTNMLTALEWTNNGETARYDIRLTESVLENNELQTDANGNVLYDLSVTKDGTAVDSNAFLTFYKGLVTFKASSRLPAGWMPQGVPHTVLTLRGEGFTRTVAFYPLDALHDAVAVNGTALFYTESSTINSVMLP